MSDEDDWDEAADQCRREGQRIAVRLGQRKSKKDLAMAEWVARYLEAHPGATLHVERGFLGIRLPGNG